MTTHIQRPQLLPVLAASLITLFLAGLAPARFAAPDLRDIPLGRLIANLEAKAEAAPEDADAHHHLARAHAMAFARGLGAEDVVKLNNRGEPDTIWFGYTPPHVPYAPQGPGGKAAPDRGGKKGDEALRHLERAIAHYEKALSLKPDDPLVMRLGLAWCRSQAGDNEKAIEALRSIVDEAWKKDSKAKRGGMRNFVTAEAIGYLKPLLDSERDAGELAELETRQEHLRALPRLITPIAVPLRDGIGAAEMVDPGAEVAFDLDGSGETTRKWQWLRPGEAAWLVHDPTGGGSITSAIQMFGNRSFTMFFEHGYEALATLDDDADGALRGAELAGLALWHDRDADGVSSRDEVSSLEHWGIVGLRCASRIGADGARYSARGVEFANGSSRPSYDLVLESRAGARELSPGPR